VALNFPNSPTLDEVYSSPDGSSYIWNGTQWVGFSSSVILSINTVPLSVEDDSVIAGTAITSINFGEYLDVTYASNRVTVDVNTLWTETGGDIYRNSSVGIQTTSLDFPLTVSYAGYGGTALYVNGGIRNTGMVSFTTNADTEYNYNGYITIGGQNISSGVALGYIKHAGNLVFGKNTGVSISTEARRNIFIGEETGSSFGEASSSDNIYIGAFSGGSYGDGNHNIFIGHGVGYKPTSPGLSGSYNVIIGPTGSSGDTLDANNDSSQILPPITDGSYQLVVGSGNTAWIHGNESFYVGFGTNTPEERVHVDGNLKVAGSSYFNELEVGIGHTLIDLNSSGLHLNIDESNNSIPLNFYSYYPGSDPNVISIEAPSGAGDYTLKLPLNDGSQYEVLTTDGIGNLSWAYPSKWYETATGIQTSSTVCIGTDVPIATLTVGGNTHISGITTASSFIGEGSGLTGIVTSLIAGSNIAISTTTGQVTIDAELSVPQYWNETVTGISTLSNVSIGTTNATNTLTISGVTSTTSLSVSGVSTFFGAITASATTNIIPFLYANYGDLPSASTYHGAFAHVHNEGKAYFAHAANWVEIVNKETNGIVGTGTESYNIGLVTATTVRSTNELSVGSSGEVLQTSSGFVGIGTSTAPTTELDVHGTVTVNGTHNVIGSTRVSTEADSAFRVGSVTDATDSNLGLFVNGLTGSSILNNDGTSGGYYLRSNGSNKWYVDYSGNQFNSGNVDIGPSIGSPQITLKSNGNSNFAGIVTASNFVGDGSGLTGIVTSLVAGSNVTISNNSGTYTINSSGGGGSDYWQENAIGISTTSNVGIATTNPQTPLQIEDVYGVKTGSGTFTASAGVAYTANTYATSDFATAEYTLFFQHSSGIQSQKVLVMDDGATAYAQEYGIMYSNDLLVSIGATVKSGNVELEWIPETGISGIVTYRYTRETMI
jgi:hypothetical protein